MKSKKNKLSSKKNKNKMKGGSITIPKSKLQFNWLTLFLFLGLIFCVGYILLMNDKFIDFDTDLEPNENPVQIINKIELPEKDIFEEKLDERLTPPGKVSDGSILDPRIHYPHVDRGIPINIRTRGQPLEYQQMGILTNASNGSVKPLYGRRTYNRSNHWNYYSSTDTDLSLKIPIFKNERKCTDEQGCNEINDGDEIKIGNISNDIYKVTMYSNDDFRYIPYI